MVWENARAVWEELATQVGGEFVCVDSFYGNPFFKVTAKLDHRTVKLDSRGYGARYSLGTRMRACYVSRDAFRFSIYPASAIAQLAEILGMQDVQIGDTSFDKDFVIRANNERQVRRLLSSDAVRALFEIAPSCIRLEARDQDEECPSLLPADIDQLHIRHNVFITNLEQLRGMFNLFRGVLQRMAEIGSIDAVDPKIDF